MNKIKSFIVNIIGKYTGVNAILSKVNGAKTYIGGIGKILTGSSAVLSGAACVLEKIGGISSASEVMKLIKGISHDPCSVAVLAGIAVVSSGLTSIGIRHAISKNVSPKRIGEFGYRYVCVF